MRNRVVQRGKSNSDWRVYANSEELQRVELLEGRMVRKLKLLEDVQRERRKIMMRCVRRKRRAEGKE